jgi:hydroxymethylbilane synthase
LFLGKKKIKVDKVVPIEEWKKLVSSAQEVLNNGDKINDGN